MSRGRHYNDRVISPQPFFDEASYRIPEEKRVVFVELDGMALQTQVPAISLPVFLTNSQSITTHG